MKLNRTRLHVDQKKMSRVGNMKLCAALIGGLFLCYQLPVFSAGITPQIPAVKPIPDNGNLPLNSAYFSGSMDYGNLATQGYVEREFYFSGKASIRDQESSAVTTADVPYVSRMVVRMPLNPKTFSGNVLIEPFHAVSEKTDIWMQTHPYITRNGDVWVGFTVKAYGVDMEPTSAYNLGGVPILKAYDAERYGPLELTPDLRPLMKAPPAPTPPQALELVSQVAALFKTNDPGSPLKGMNVKKVYLVGSGVNGEIIANYVRTKMDEVWRLQNDKPLIDGYLAGATNRYLLPSPRGAAFALFRSENELERTAFAGYIGKDLDSPAFRIYNVPGTAHLGTKNLPSNGSTAFQINAILPKPELNMPYVTQGPSCPYMNDEPVDLFISALVSGLEKWGRDGTPLPRAPLPELLPGTPGAKLGDVTGAADDNPQEKVALVRRDALTGNVLGGVRLPWVEAPVAQFPVQAPRPTGSPPPAAPGAPAAPPVTGPASASEAEPPPDIIHGDKPGQLRPREVASGPVTIADAWPRATKDKPKLPTRPGRPFCFLFNPRLPYDQATLHKIYKSYDDYVDKFELAKAKAIKEGWILKEDAPLLRPRGNPADF